MGGITAFDEPLAHSGVEALVSVAIDRRIVEAVHCGKAVLEIAAAAHVAPATFAAGRGRGVRHRLDLLEDRIAEEVAQRVRFHGMHRRAAVPVERRDIAVVDRYGRSEEHTSELQSLMRISYAVFCLKKKIKAINNRNKYTR